MEVGRSASADEIKKAFKRLAKKYHPDAHPNDPALANKFKEVNEAHHVLGDSIKRKAYDRQLNNDRIPPGMQAGSDDQRSAVNDLLNTFDKFDF